VIIAARLHFLAKHLITCFIDTWRKKESKPLFRIKYLQYSNFLGPYMDMAMGRSISKYKYMIYYDKENISVKKQRTVSRNI